MRINETVKELRAKENMTQAELAEKLNCNRQKIADWERGKTTPAADDIILLAKIFNVSADYLLGISKVKTNDRDVRFICEYTGLREKTIQELQGVKGYHKLLTLLDCLISTVIQNYR